MDRYSCKWAVLSMFIHKCWELRSSVMLWPYCEVPGPPKSPSLSSLEISGLYRLFTSALRLLFINVLDLLDWFIFKSDRTPDVILSCNLTCHRFIVNLFAVKKKKNCWPRGKEHAKTGLGLINMVHKVSVIFNSMSAPKYIGQLLWIYVLHCV